MNMAILMIKLVLLKLLKNSTIHNMKPDYTITGGKPTKISIVRNRLKANRDREFLQ